MSQTNKKVFLSAGWYNLLLFNYNVRPEILEPLLPKGCELDMRDGFAHASLVAFQFHKTKVLGIPWPGFTHFSEVNLRFYVRYNGERGVCFVKEYVPSKIISSIARFLYNEPYKFAKMKDSVKDNGAYLTAEYNVQDGNRHMRFYARAENKPYTPNENTVEHHFKEHELGVGRDRSGKTLTYRVHHPVWRIYPVVESAIEVEALEMYGDRFNFLSTTKPNSVIFAEGSEIQVFHKD